MVSAKECTKMLINEALILIVKFHPAPFYSVRTCGFHDYRVTPDAYVVFMHRLASVCVLNITNFHHFSCSWIDNYHSLIMRRYLPSA